MFGAIATIEWKPAQNLKLHSHPRVGRYQKLVEFMGGEIGVESVVAVESAFWIELPSVESPQIKGSK